MKSVLLLSIIVINFFLQTMIYANVFKCVKPDGSTYYSDRPCAAGLNSKKIILNKKPSSETLEDYSDDDAALIDKLNKHRYKQALIDKKERHRKDAIRVAEKRVRNRLGQKRREEIALKTQQAGVINKSKQRINRHKAWMESRERSGEAMSEEDKEWRNWDNNTITKKAIYEARVSTQGTKEYKERESEKRNAAQAELRQKQLDIEFNNTRYEGNDTHY